MNDSRDENNKNKKLLSTYHRFKGCSLLDQEYTLADKIGQGTFGVVFKATSKSTKQVVAIKKILIHTAKDGFPTTSIREISFLKLLNHRNIVQLVDMSFSKAPNLPLENSNPMFYMVFPYIDHDLTGLLERQDFNPSTSQIKLYMLQLCEGTAFMHANGVLHRDMKASNILISNDGSLKIADFGLARICHKLQQKNSKSKSRNYTNMVVTRFYRPPELILGEKNSWGDYGPEIDIWGLGCIFGEMFTHKPILQGHTDIDQLKRIFELCGDPTSESWPGWETIKGQYSIDIKTFGYKNGNLKEKFMRYNNFDLSALELLEKLLTMDPKRRISAKDALKLDYFWTKPLPMKKEDVKPLPSSHEYDSRKQMQAKQYTSTQKARPPVNTQMQQPYMSQKMPSSGSQFSSRPVPAYRPPGGQFSARPAPPSGFRGSHQRGPRPPSDNPYGRPSTNQMNTAQNPPINPYSAYSRSSHGRPPVQGRPFGNDRRSQPAQPPPPRFSKPRDDDIVVDYGAPDYGPSDGRKRERREPSPRRSLERPVNRRPDEKKEDRRSDVLPKAENGQPPPPKQLPPKQNIPPPPVEPKDSPARSGSVRDSKASLVPPDSAGEERMSIDLPSRKENINRPEDPAGTSQTKGIARRPSMTKNSESLNQRRGSKDSRDDRDEYSRYDARNPYDRRDRERDWDRATDYGNNYDYDYDYDYDRGGNYADSGYHRNDRGYRPMNKKPRYDSRAEHRHHPDSEYAYKQQSGQGGFNRERSHYRGAGPRHGGISRTQPYQPYPDHDRTPMDLPSRPTDSGNPDEKAVNESRNHYTHDIQRGKTDNGANNTSHRNDDTYTRPRAHTSHTERHQNEEGEIAP
ncbi:Pkinase-domain-containing protein [Wallemia mellicola]|uniref:Pkinase-domain-containing protein n=1 Tax=Wallemia mellicola TaxID=1708541 RepID=A0A4T0TJJ0_9BASI|nr:Pkinase-domain-containing protein [Wallemia mellicola]